MCVRVGVPVDTRTKAIPASDADLSIPAVPGRDTPVSHRCPRVIPGPGCFGGRRSHADERPGSDCPPTREL